MGLGYVTLSDRRLSQVDFLSWMGELEFVMVSARLKEVTTSYTTVVRPLDMHTWCFLGVSLLLIMMVLTSAYWANSCKHLMHRGLFNTLLTNMIEMFSG